MSAAAPWSLVLCACVAPELCTAPDIPPPPPPRCAPAARVVCSAGVIWLWRFGGGGDGMFLLFGLGANDTAWYNNKTILVMTCMCIENRTDSEMAGRHRCRPRSIQIIRTGIVAAKDTKRPDVQQFHVSTLLLWVEESRELEPQARQLVYIPFSHVFFRTFL